MNARPPSPPAAEPESSAEAQKAHLDQLLDEALAETFPASDPPAITQPAPTAEDGAEEKPGR